MLFVGTSIIHPSTEGVFLLCNILDLLIYSYQFLLYFDKLYDKFTDLEKKEFLNSFVEQVDIYEQEQPDGRFLKHIKFRFPVYFGDREIQELCWNNESTVETVVLMSKQRNKDQLPGRDGEIRQLNSLRVYGQSEVRADGLCRS